MNDLNETNEVIQEQVTELVEASEPAPLTEEQNALMVYQTYLNKFIKALMGYKGSRKQIERSWVNAAIAPMNKDPLVFKYKAEEELFDLFKELNSAKFVLMLYGFVNSGAIEIKKSLFEATTEQQSKDEVLNKLVEQRKEEIKEVNKNE